MKAERVRYKRLLLAAIMLVLLAPVYGCGSATTTTEQNAVPTTATAPDPRETTPSTSTGSSPSEAAIAQAKAEGKPVLLKFGSGTCIPCKEIEENINTIKPEYEGRVVFIIVDVYNAQDENLTMRYRIQTIPTTFFLGKDGNIVNQQVGVMTPDQLRQQLNTML